MKKLFLLTITAGLAVSSFAQSANFTGKIGNKQQVHANAINGFAKAEVANKTSLVTIHDSLLLSNVVDTDQFVYPANQGSGTDSGFIFGTSVFGLNGFAERYDFNSADSTVKILGVASIFVGQYNPATANTAVFKAWTMGSPVTGSTNVFYSGFPTTVLDSTIVSYANLGIDNSGATDTLKIHWFATPTAYLSASFFVGFTSNYNWGAMNGDTVTVLVSGSRRNSVDSIVAVDTIVNDQNVTLNGGTWLDNGWDLGANLEYFLFPIVDTKDSTHLGVKLTNKDFSFNGNYPNPAVNNMNVKFTLANSTSVTIQIMDINGRTINTINKNNMSAGEHTVNIETANMPAGDYVYIIRTTEGGGIASKFAVIK